MEQKTIQKQPIDVTKKDRFHSLKTYLRKRPPKKRLIIVIAVSLAVLAGGSVASFTLIKPSVEPTPDPVIESTYVATPPEFKSPLTGMLTDEASSKRPVTAVMIENSIDARPQSGLEQAGVVFEAIAEGGITRFVALYQEARPTNIGPIRSARVYFVEWVKGFDARYVHAGGSPEGIALISTLGIKDLDQGRYGGRIANRVSNRYAPHNLYSSMDLIDTVGSEVGFTSSDFTPFARKAEPEEKPITTASTINFNISGANYNTAYTYNPETNTYARTMAGRPHSDQESGKQISPKVVVALIANYRIHPNGIHSIYDSIGSGEIIVFQDGIATTGTWSKPTQSAPLTFLTPEGKPLELNPGQTWITAIAPGRVSYAP